MASSSFDDDFMEFMKEFSPDSAYIIGFDECAGKIFVPSEENLRAAKRRIRTLKGEATTELQRKSAASLETALLLEEPQPVLDSVVMAIFAHLAKEGINEQHLVSLLKESQKAVDATRQRFRNREVPVGVKVLTLYRLDGITSILDTLRSEAKSPRITQECEELARRVKEFVSEFGVEGFGQGEFENVEKVFAREGFALGREKFYPKALKDGFDYDETPAELERLAISWIDEELPKFRKATVQLAKELGCKPVPEQVEEKVNSRMKLDPKKLVRTTMALRKVVQPFMNADVHGINPKYKTTVIETPRYLTGTIPTGAAQFFDTFTKRPFQYFFQTTDPKRDPDKSVAALLNLLVHEEYGHCVHHSNSALGFVGKVNRVQLIPVLPTGGPVTEGLSFNRELEFLEASKRLEKKTLTKVERDYVKELQKYGGLRLVNLELEFWTRRYRLVRFLRVVGDVRINTGKQTIMGFVDWAKEYTGVPRSSVYFQLFPAHEGIFPGYATSYAVVGQEIRRTQTKIRGDKARVKFSTYLCSIGFPPRTIYRRMLRDYAKTLK